MHVGTCVRVPARVYVCVYKATVASVGREKHLAFGYPNKGNAAKNI